MSTTAIDQLLQIATPTPLGRKSTRAGNADGDRFRAHLDRAADAKKTKPPTGGDDGLRAQADEDEPLEAQTEQHETATSQQEETRATAESSETVEPTKAAPVADETSDEVTLSAAAVAQIATANAEITTTPEQAASAAAAVETTTSDNQQQLNGRSVANLAEAADNANAAAAATSAAETGIELSGAETESEAAVASKKSSTDAESDQGTEKQKTTPVTNSLPAASADEGQSEDTKVIAQQPTTAQSQTTKSAEAVAETETTDRSAQHGARKTEVQPPVLATQAASAVIDAELTNATTNLGSSETNASANAPTSSSETVAIADRSLGSALTGKAANQTNSASGQEATETPTVDRARFVHRVGGAIRNAQLRDGQIQLRLSPPELGTLRIQLIVNEGGITAHLEAETAAARTILLDNLPALRERLAQQGMTIEKFDVDVGRDGQQQADNPSADNPSDEERQANNSRTRAARATTSEKAQESTTTEDDSHLMQQATDSGLDVRI